MLIVMFFAQPIVQIIYMRGAFTMEAAVRTATALAFLSPGMIALAVNEVFSKSFFAKKDGLTPMLAAIIGIVVNIILVLTLSHLNHLSIATLALSSAMGSNAMMVTLLISSRKHRA
jgi:putative peptidoglycan lipid II flippase